VSSFLVALMLNVPTFNAAGATDRLRGVGNVSFQGAMNTQTCRERFGCT
jgi:hypothetical protein